MYVYASAGVIAVYKAAVNLTKFCKFRGSQIFRGRGTHLTGDAEKFGDGILQLWVINEHFVQSWATIDRTTY